MSVNVDLEAGTGPSFLPQSETFSTISQHISDNLLVVETAVFSNVRVQTVLIGTAHASQESAKFAYEQVGAVTAHFSYPLLAG